jgi:hypothetical protein
LKVEIRRIEVQSQVGQKVQWTPSSPYISTGKKKGVVGHSCHPSYMKHVNRRITVQVSLQKMCETLSQK